MNSLKYSLVVAAFGVISASSASAAVIMSQDWSNTGMITTNDDWSGVSGIVGHLGDIDSAVNADPQTLTADLLGAVDVIANQTSPNTFGTGGVAEFEITDPVVALNGSGTADAPSLLITVNTSGYENVNIAYNLRDIDGSIDNSAQQVGLMYRLGTSGTFTNVAAGYIADASFGPSATGSTPVSTSDAAWDDAGTMQFRVLTTNATGNDEWIGIDDIMITGDAIVVPEPATLGLAGLAAIALLKRRR